MKYFILLILLQVSFGCASSSDKAREKWKKQIMIEHRVDIDNPDDRLGDEDYYLLNKNADLPADTTEMYEKGDCLAETAEAGEDGEFYGDSFLRVLSPSKKAFTYLVRECEMDFREEQVRCTKARKTKLTKHAVIECPEF